MIYKLDIALCVPSLIFLYYRLRKIVNSDKSLFLIGLLFFYQPIPGFSRDRPERHLGLPDRTVTTPWYKCNGDPTTEGMWYDRDPGSHQWIPTRNRIGDDTDPFTPTNNNLFTPWSNPSSYSPLTGGNTNYSVWIYAQNGNNISVQVKTTESSSLSLPPSKPHLGWDPRDLGRPFKQGWIYLAWNISLWDNYPIEPDINWSELQRKIGTGSWVTVYSGPNMVWEDGSITYDPNGNIPVYFRVRVRDTQNQWSIWSNIFNTKMINWIPWKSSIECNLMDKPLEYSLMQNYPNPFNPATTISYSIPNYGLVTIKVYDILGTEVASLVNENKGAGYYSIEFNASELPSGIYFYTILLPAAL
jgi:hypothetical protein